MTDILVPNSARTLTDADVTAIASALESRLATRFALNIGRGFLNLIWKGILLAAVGLAAYGIKHGSS